MSKDHPHKIKIFFDESRKDKDYPNLMGAVLIPTACYELDSLNDLYDLIKEGKKPIHWTDYTGDSSAKRRRITLVKKLMVYQHLLKVNVISYKMNKFEEMAKPIKSFYSEITDHTIYTKLPERVVYGLVRKYGQDTYIDASVFIEHNTSYSGTQKSTHSTDHTSNKKDLKVTMFEQLNIQSLYRGERYRIREVSYLLKRKEFGIEFIDIMLGIIRTIIQNNTQNSRSSRMKNELVLEMLETIPNLSHLLNSNVTLYEWNEAQKELTTVPLTNYLNVFLSTNLK
ncbi:hypothetical protein [Sporosarcina obsidiansis]|uniref:hypothetical protein n=1 Tax=Sporosarcina obsidiansis TaxID=2660748 RepID=UPI00129A8A6C|nr:hypothetical protein [Sporosarcina obsidiansis]